MSQSDAELRQTLPWWEQGNLSAIAPPPGVTPNFIDPVSKAHIGVGVYTTCIVLATIMVAIRMFTKHRILKNAGWDDHTALVAWAFLMGYIANCFLEDKYGSGKHLWDINGYAFVKYAKHTWITQIIYAPTIFFAKLSIILLYLRVFNPINVSALVLQMVLWLNFTYYLIGIFIEIFQCIPVKKVWYPQWPGHCVNQQATQLTSGIINTISDVIIILLPIGSIWKLKVHRKGKIGLLIIFSFGILGCGASIARAALFGAYGRPTITTDATWIFYPVSLLSAVEITCALLCSCIPALPAFLRYLSGLQIKVIITQNSSRRVNPFGSSNGFSKGSTYGNSNSKPDGPPFSPLSPSSMRKFSRSHSRAGATSPQWASSPPRTRGGDLAFSPGKEAMVMTTITGGAAASKGYSPGSSDDMSPDGKNGSHDHWVDHYNQHNRSPPAIDVSDRQRRPSQSPQPFSQGVGAAGGRKAAGTRSPNPYRPPGPNRTNRSTEAVGLAISSGGGGGGGGAARNTPPPLLSTDSNNSGRRNNKWGVGGRDPYEDLNDLQYVRGDELRSPHDSSTAGTPTPSPGTPMDEMKGGYGFGGGSAGTGTVRNHDKDLEGGGGVGVASTNKARGDGRMGWR